MNQNFGDIYYFLKFFPFYIFIYFTETIKIVLKLLLFSLPIIVFAELTKTSNNSNNVTFLGIALQIWTFINNYWPFTQYTSAQGLPQALVYVLGQYLLMVVHVQSVMPYKITLLYCYSDTVASLYTIGVILWSDCIVVHRHIFSTVTPVL